MARRWRSERAPAVPVGAGVIMVVHLRSCGEGPIGRTKASAAGHWENIHQTNSESTRILTDLSKSRPSSECATGQAVGSKS